jgi:hypothetical protein
MVVEEGRLIEMIEKRVGVKERRGERMAFEEEAITNLLFWANKPEFWIEYGRIMCDSVYEDGEFEVRYRANLIRARTDTAVAKVLGLKAGFEVRPPSGSARSREIAEMSNRVFDHIRQVTDYEQIQLVAELMAAIYGSSFIWCQWDPKRGEPQRFYWTDKVTKTAVPETMLSRAQRDEKVATGMYQDLPPGDMRLEVSSPFGFYFDSAARDTGIKGAHWVAKSSFVDRARVAERFNMKEEDVPVVEDDSGLLAYEEAIAFMSSDHGLGMLQHHKPEEKLGKRTRYTEMWQRPDREFPKGLRVCCAGGKILNPGSLDNPHCADLSGEAHLPVVKVDWKPHPGRFWGVSYVEDLRIPQYYTNRLRSSVISFNEAHGQPATYVDKSTGLDSDKMTSQIARVYQTNPGTANSGVKIGPTPQMPIEVMQATIFTESDLNKLASQSEVQGEKLPGQIRSGAAMRAVNEERFAGLSIPAMMSVRATRDVGRVALAVGKLFYGTERLLKYQGEDRRWVVEAFNGMDLVNDVVIVGAPDVTETSNSEEQKMLDAVVAGAFNPQFDRTTKQLILKGLHYGTSAEFFSRQLQGEKNAERVIGEILLDPMRYGEEGYPAFEWQDHEAEADALVAFMYTPEFWELGKKGPVGRAAQATITTYWKKHRDFMLQEQLAQMQMIEATKGAPGQPGQASQPKAARN